jgi:hypothetical protein
MGQQGETQPMPSWPDEQALFVSALTTVTYVHVLPAYLHLLSLPPGV